jgi:hypothetical protein
MLEMVNNADKETDAEGYKFVIRLQAGKERPRSIPRSETFGNSEFSVGTDKFVLAQMHRFTEPGTPTSYSPCSPSALITTPLRWTSACPGT